MSWKNIYTFWIMMRNSVKPIGNDLSDSILPQIYSRDRSSKFPLILGLEYVPDEWDKTPTHLHTNTHAHASTRACTHIHTAGMCVYMSKCNGPKENFFLKKEAVNKFPKHLIESESANKNSHKQTNVILKKI